MCLATSGTESAIWLLRRSIKRLAGSLRTECLQSARPGLRIMVQLRQSPSFGWTVRQPVTACPDGRDHHLTPRFRLRNHLWSAIASGAGALVCPLSGAVRLGTSPRAGREIQPNSAILYRPISPGTSEERVRHLRPLEQRYLCRTQSGHVDAAHTAEVAPASAEAG